VPALRRQTETDPKVGLFNSRYFADTVEQEILRANRFDRPLSLVMADLDFLRRVNNIYGHLAGDVVLKGVAEILRTSVRDLDIVARFGGEEFAILMPETTPEQAFLTAERIRQAIQEAEFSVATSVAPIKVTMSFGLAGRLERDLTANELIHQADLAVMEAKQEGRNCSRIYGGRATNFKKAPAVSTSPLVGVVKSQESGSASEDIVVPERPTFRERLNQTKPAEDGPLRQRLETLFHSFRPWMLKFYVSAVATVALILIYLAIQPHLTNDWLGLTAFLILVILAEVLSVNIYAKETSVSTSVAALVAGVVLFGPVAAVILGLGVALAAFFRQRSQLDRLIFNSSNHVIGGMIAAGIVLLTGQEFLELAMPLQILVTMLAISFIYLSTTALVAGAVSLNHRRPFFDIWNERFRWLSPYYLALGVVAYTLIFSFSTAGLLGIVVVLVPLAMLRLSQKQYVRHTKNVVSQLREKNVKLTQQSEEINLLNEELLITLAKANDLRDPYVMEHSQNVARYAVLIAKEMGLSAERVEMIRKAGLLHDIGKLSIPDAILFKPGRLSEEEYAKVKEHVTIGADLIQGCHSLRPLSPIIRHHHEHYNGAGYPDRLVGEQIPLEARILGVADALEAMASDRPYRHGRTPEGIVEELNQYASTQFDPEAVKAFTRVIEKDGEAVIINSAREVLARQNGDDSVTSDFAFNPAFATG
jgi:diguanylate cyclase (GGDEF)-like protein/putative nucleotidyltransferase with HDIG domain